MKRILSLVLILILSLSVLTACGDKQSTSYNMDNAKATLVELYPELAPTKDNPTPATRKDFHVVKVLTCTDGKYTVAWTTNNDANGIVNLHASLWDERFGSHPNYPANSTDNNHVYMMHNSKNQINILTSPILTTTTGSTTP